LLFEEVGSGQDGTLDLKKLFNNTQIFDFPKPVKLIKHLLAVSTENSDIVLDFFSGSATCAQAVMEINAEDSSNRKHIQIQLPEPLDEKNEAFKMGFKTVSDIGKERIRKVASKIQKEYPDKFEDMDLGFKAFKLDSSNIKAWDGNPENLEESLFDSIETIKPDRTQEDVIYELLLKYGLDLAVPIERKKIKGKYVFNVDLGSLFICLEDDIQSEIAEEIGKWKDKYKPENCCVIFKDSGFTDKEKINSVQKLKKFGITNIRSI